MKKFIAIILSTLIIVSSCLCMGASATSSKTEALLEQITQTKTLALSIKDDTLTDNVFDVSDMKLMFKVDPKGNVVSDMKMAATAKSGILQLHTILGGEENLIYISNLRCYVSFDEIFDSNLNIDISLLATNINLILKYFNTDYLGNLNLTFAGEKEVDGYGNVYVERFGTRAEFYYDGDVLVGFRFIVFDAQEFIISVDSSVLLPSFVEGISSGVEDSMFEKPTGFHINITPLVKFIYNIVKTFQS